MVSIHSDAPSPSALRNVIGEHFVDPDFVSLRSRTVRVMLASRLSAAAA
jgi:hypothetical protein